MIPTSKAVCAAGEKGMPGPGSSLLLKEGFNFSEVSVPCNSEEDL